MSWGNLDVLQGHPATFTRQPSWSPLSAGATIRFLELCRPSSYSGRHEADGGADRHGWTAIRPSLPATERCHFRAPVRGMGLILSRRAHPKDSLHQEALRIVRRRLANEA
ncbi:hypothetical protein J4G37_19445 [Microvirga sp. 3-52]|nr:hypothetical protein [Microvirga sp. 3-52]